MAEQNNEQQRNIININPKTYPVRLGFLGFVVTNLIAMRLLPEPILIAPVFGLIGGWFVGWWLRINNMDNQPNQRGLPEGWVLCAGGGLFWLVTLVMVTIPTAILVLSTAYTYGTLLINSPTIIREAMVIIAIVLVFIIVIGGIGLGKISERRLIYWLGNEDKWSLKPKRKSKPKNDK